MQPLAPPIHPHFCSGNPYQILSNGELGRGEERGERKRAVPALASSSLLSAATHPLQQPKMTLLRCTADCLMRLPTDYPITQFHTSRPLPIYSLGLQDPTLSFLLGELFIFGDPAPIYLQ